MTADVTLAVPSCPLCGKRTTVERLEHEIRNCGFFCGPCCLIFEGTDAEWRVYGKKRAEHIEYLNRKAEERGQRPDERESA